MNETDVLSCPKCDGASLQPVSAGEVLTWSDVVLDETDAALKVRRQMEAAFGARAEAAE